VPQGDRLAEWKNVGGGIYSVCWSRDGRRLAVNGCGKVTFDPFFSGVWLTLLQADVISARSPEPESRQRFPPGQAQPT
jgi:hypothetical protein